MCSNFDRNNIDVDARPQAVSIRAGEGCFEGGGHNGHLNSEMSDSITIQVQVANLREAIARLSPQRLLLKLDVEGEEDKILPDLLPALPLTSAIFFEWHHGNETLKETEERLRAAGFAVKRCRTREDDAYVDAFAIRS